MSFIRKIKKGKKVYLAEVENCRINGKVVQKHIRYVGREVDGKTLISISSADLKVNKVKIYGPLLILNSIADQIKLPEILGSRSGEILSMVYAHCLNYKSVNSMPSWFKRTDLNVILNLQELTESRLLSALDVINKDYIETCQKRLFKRMKSLYSLTGDGVVYDVTNTYLHGTKCQLAKLGKSKEGRRDRPLIQIGLATTQKEGIPIFHKVFDGNTHDSRTFAFFIDSFSDYNLPSGLFVYDRGIASNKNISLAKRLGWDVLCGIPIRDREKKVIRETVKGGSLADISNRVIVNKKNVCYIKSLDYIAGGVKGKLVICYNEQRRINIREARYDEITAAQGSILEGKSIKRGLGKYLTPAGRIRKFELKSSEEFDGYSCIFSSKKLSAEEMVRLYFEKDIVERAFKTLKGITQLRPVRHWLHNRVTAHVFICYLSYLLLSVLKLKIHRLGVSPDQGLRDLADIYKVYFSDKEKKNKFERTVAISRQQEKILKAVDKNLLKSL